MRKQMEESAAAEGARRATGAAAGRGRGERFSARRKRAVVLRLLRGEDLESVSRELRITAARASQWGPRSVSGRGAGGPEAPCDGGSGRGLPAAAGQDPPAYIGSVKWIPPMPGYTEICRDIVGYSRMGPRRLRPMIRHAWFFSTKPA